MNDSLNTEIIIVGAGLTGLTLAYYLHKNGVKFILLEKEKQLGGVIQTHSEDGFIYESGPNTGVVGNPEIAELFEDLGATCELEIADAEAKKRLIWKKGKWHALPSGPLSAIKTPLFRFKDKLRILGEPFRKKGNDPLESLASMIKRRLGKSFLDYAINPFISGVYAGNPEKLITKYALPKMYRLEQDYGSLIKGGIKKSKANKLDKRLAKATREVFSVNGGLSNLIKALEQAIPKEQILVDFESLTFDKTKEGYLAKLKRGNQNIKIQSNQLVTTIGAHSLSELLPFISEKALKPITELQYAKVALIIMGYKEWNGDDINAFGGLVPKVENKNILGILFTSSFFKNRAPKEGALLSVFAGGSRFSSAIELSDEELKELALANVKEMLGTNLAPDLFKVYRYKNGIAQYEASSKERLEAVELLQNQYSGLYLAGNIRDGIGMADRVKQAKDLANEIVIKLKS